MFRTFTSLAIALILAIVTLVSPAFALDDVITQQVLKTNQNTSLNLEKISLETSIDEQKKAEGLESSLNEISLEPPAQPTEGPGGSNYKYKKMKATSYCIGKTGTICLNNRKYWIFEPLDSNGDLVTSEDLPVIVFLHGFSLLSPNNYGGWIEHIVRKGNIVIFPVFQRLPGSLVTQLSVDTAIDATNDAIEKLKKDYTNNENIADKKIALIGHSVGGAMAANFAGKAGKYKTFMPVAIVSVEPCSPFEPMISEELLSKIPDYSYLLSIVGEQDKIAKDGHAKKIFDYTTSIAKENKDFVTINSDLRNIAGRTKNHLRADHFAPLSCKKITKEETTECKIFKYETNAIDYYGFWKLSVALSNLGFKGQDSEYALGGTTEQRYMGQWSDGTYVNQLDVTDDIVSDPDFRVCSLDSSNDL